MLFVLTDGQPTDMTATRKALKMAHKIGLEVYGLGILGELPVALFDILGKNIIGIPRI